MNYIQIDFFNLIMVVGAVQGVTFTLITLLSKIGREKTIIYLSMTVLYLSMNNLQYWFTLTELTAPIKYYKHLLLPWYFLIVPSFYQFVRGYLGLDKRLPSLNKPTYFIFGFGIIIRLLLIIYIHFISGNTSNLEVLVTYNLLEETVSLFYSIFIFSYCIYVINYNKQWFKDLLSNEDLKWIKQFFKFGSVVLVFWVLAVLQHYTFKYFEPPESYYPVRLGTSFLIYWIGYRGLFKYRIHKNRIVIHQILHGQAQENTHSHTSGKVGVFQRFENLVLQQKKYLDSDIGLETIADELEVSPSHLSSVINKFCGMNLTNYLNELRVEHAKMLLSNKEFDHYTILGIGMESGFNSKSTFYSAFKKHTSMPPSAYRKMLESRKKDK
ncbi:MAG: AraC family transcriptional regulator [Bacteroidota bacterium]